MASRTLGLAQQGARSILQGQQQGCSLFTHTFSFIFVVVPYIFCCVDVGSQFHQTIRNSERRRCRLVCRGFKEDRIKSYVQLI